jgi:GntR family transcriptional regulator / MocR family aminotransferase
MPETWATSGLDLHLEVGRSRVRAGLENALRTAVRTGRLAAGARLPSSRSLAADLGIARNTVADAYGQLVAEGWLVARRGSGTRVSDRAPELAAGPPPAPDEGARLRYSLRPGSPNLSGFPRSAWLTASRRAIRAAPFDSLGYDDPRGRLELRRALAGYLARARGVRTSPERLVICSGFTQGLGLLSEVLRSRGAQVLAVEAFGLPAHREVAESAGLELRPLPIDAHGAQTDELGDAGAALLTPAHQFPRGMALAPARRVAAVEWATRSSGLLIEDDYDGEFRYDRQPVGALQALAPEHVVYAGTASKTLAPGLRLGWLALPAGLVDDVAAAKARADCHSGTPDQLTLAELIESGAYDRHIRRSRLAYRRRRDRLVEALRREAPEVRVAGIAAGLHVLVELPAGQSEVQVVARAEGRGLALEGLAAYALDDSERGPAVREGPGSARTGAMPSLVVGYGTPADHEFTAAVARLTATLAQSEEPTLE